MPTKRIPVDVRSLARSYTELCIRGLAGIVQKSESDTARVAAAGLLLDRGWGKSMAAIDPDGGDVVVTIRTIVQQIGQPMKVIEHDDDDEVRLTESSDDN
jgi:hypothetical protein